MPTTPCEHGIQGCNIPAANDSIHPSNTTLYERIAGKMRHKSQSSPPCKQESHSARLAKVRPGPNLCVKNSRRGCFNRTRRKGSAASLLLSAAILVQGVIAAAGLVPNFIIPTPRPGRQTLSLFDEYRPRSGLKKTPVLPFLSTTSMDASHTKSINHRSSKARRRRKAGRGRGTRWENFTGPPSGRGHDEVTFRSGCEGRTLTIPQAERYSSAAWWHNLRTLGTSVILHRIKHPLLAQTCWATAVSLVHAAFGGAWSMSIKPHTLLGSALGLLLVFRTNAAYQRFQEGRKLWEQLLNVSRDIARMSTLHEDVFGKRLVKRIANLLALHAVILQEHLQGYKLPRVWRDLVRPDEEEDLLQTTCNRPLKVVNMIAREIKTVPYSGDGWSSRERLAILSMCNKLSATIGGCERLVQTPVPLHYVRHTSRFLTIWCFLLPLVIVGEMGMATGPVVCMAAWALFGIQEIGLLIEDPFQSALSLEVLCNTVYSDVMQTIGAEDPTQPQQPIPMQPGIAVVELGDTPLDEEVLPLSARCRHPAHETTNDSKIAAVAY